MHASVSVLIAALSAGAFAVPLTFTNSTSPPAYTPSTRSSTSLYSSTSTPAYKQSTTTPYVPTTTKYAEDKTDTKTDTITKTETKTITDTYYDNGYTSYKTYLTSYVYTTTTKDAVPYTAYAPEPTHNQANGCPAYTTTVTVKEAPSGAAYYYPPGQKCDNCQEVKYYDVSLGIDVTIFVPHVKETVYHPRPTPNEYCQYGYDNHGNCKKQTSSYYQYTTSSSSRHPPRPTSTFTRSTTRIGLPSDVKTILPIGTPSSATTFSVVRPDATVNPIRESSSTTASSVVRPDATVNPIRESSTTTTFSVVVPDVTVLPVKGSLSTTVIDIVKPDVTIAPRPVVQEANEGPTPTFEVVPDAFKTGV